MVVQAGFRTRHLTTVAFTVVRGNATLELSCTNNNNKNNNNEFILLFNNIIII